MTHSFQPRTNCPACDSTAWVPLFTRPLFSQALNRAVDQSGGILSPKLLDYAESMQAGRIPFNTSLWRCVSLGAWMDAYNVSTA